MDKKKFLSQILDGLNREQHDAVTTTKGPLLIIAGAGTGKTTVIARRIAYLIGKKLAKADEILALTFTDKAANEMEERVDQLLPFGVFDTNISTFHSFGEKVLREHALDLGLPTDFKILTRPQQFLFFQQNLFRFDLQQYRPLATPTKFIQALITLFSRAKDENISPEDYGDFVDNLNDTRHSERVVETPVSSRSLESQTSQVRKVPNQVEDDNRKDSVWDQLEIEKQQELAKCFAQYETLKDQAGLLDFGDLIVKTLDLFIKQPAILKKYQQQFKYILVDEFQDTNFVQNELVKILACEHNNICVVGDDDQSIYRFRGAAISNILQFQKNYPKAKEIVLTTNYRSTQPILDASYKLIRNNDPDRLEFQNKINKKLMSAKSESGFPIQTIFSATLTDEVDAVVAEIERLTSHSVIQSPKPVESPDVSAMTLKSDFADIPGDPSLITQDDKSHPIFDSPLHFSDIAILVRANNHADPFLHALAAKGIPYKFTGTSGLYDQPEIKSLLSFLTVIANFYDTLALFNVAVSSYYDLPIEGLIKLMDLARRKSRSLYWAIEHVDHFSKTLELTDKQIAATKNLKADLIKYAELAKNQNAGTVLFQFLKDKDVFKNLEHNDTQESATAMANITKLFDKIAEFNRAAVDQSVQAFVDYLQIMREAGDDPGTGTLDIEFDGVQVMTVHAAKGLEFKAVFIVNAVFDRFPSRDRSEPIPLPSQLIKETLPVGDFHLQEERRLFYVATTRATDLLYITWAKDYGGKRLKKSSPFVAEALGVDNLPLAIMQTTTKKLVEQLDLFWTPTKRLSDASGQLSFAIDDERLLQLNQAQVEEYLTCPLRYKFSAILRIPLARSHLFIYGSAVHTAIETFYKAKMQKKMIELPALLETFENAWVDEGFLSEEHGRERFNQGKKVLAAFYKREKKLDQVPTWIEKPFKVMVRDSIKLVGRMDRVDITGDNIHILDFKTTENMTQAKADKRAKDSLQLACYAFAFYKMSGKLPNKLSLYFVEDGLYGSIIPTMDIIQKAEAQILAAAAGIRSQDFSPKPEFNTCRYCAYAAICPAAVLK